MMSKINLIKVVLESLSTIRDDKLKTNISTIEILQKIDEDLHINVVMLQILLDKDDKYLNYFVAKFDHLYNKNYNKKSPFFIPKQKLNSLAIITLYLLKESITNDEFRIAYEAGENINIKNYENIKYLLKKIVFSL